MPASHRDQLLRRALDDAGARVLYQPIVDAASCLCGVDAVPRVFVPGRGLVDPADVGALSASFGATSIEHWIIGESVAQARRWRELVPGARPFVVCALSAAALVDREIDRLVEQALEAHAITPDQIRLSMAPATLVGAGEAQHDAMVALRLEGVEIGVTHVTAQSPWDTSGFEIPSFVVIDVSTADTGVADEARGRGLAVVASGVEDEQDARQWQRCSNHLVGRWYAEPAGPEVITAMLRSGRRLTEPAAR